MKLIDALQILRRPVADDVAKLTVSLVCGFTPLHLETFLAAELRQAFPMSRIQVASGTFDDLLGSLQRAAQSNVDAVAVVVEWADIDPRLGLRRLGGWSLADLSNIVDQVEHYLTQLESGLTNAAESTPIICALPTLPLPPLFLQRSDESGPEELALRACLASFAARLARHPGVRICNAQRLDERSSIAVRRDVKAELSTGFPYSLGHASALAQAIAVMIHDPTPKKGLITDLDDTLWAGLVGEVGAAKVSWDLDSHSQRHAIYQQFLASLASSGTLIGVASKNDPDLVRQVFDRPDLLLAKEAVFPSVVHWGPKSASVQRILEAWNVSSDAVVIVDDSPIEIAEVQDAFPDIEGVTFPGSDDSELLPFLSHLRALFGKHTATTEDALRVKSLRSTTQFRELAAQPTSSSDDFLARAEGELEFSCGHVHKQRALDLFNKTNQFNLNGKRISEAAFHRALSDPATSLVTVNYQDRYGPLGTIAALLVRFRGEALAIDAWVMSCRAFSRRIEHHCLDFLFDKSGLDEITAAFLPTKRNGPVQDFLSSMLAEAPDGTVRLTLEGFRQRGPRLVHRVSEAAR